MTAAPARPSKAPWQSTTRALTRCMTPRELSPGRSTVVAMSENEGLPETERASASSLLPTTFAGRTKMAARAFGAVVFKGVPAMRAALHGARLGAGTKLSARVIEKLGVAVIPRSAASVASEVAQRAGEFALVVQRRGAVLRAGAREFALHAPEGLTLRVTREGSALATLTHDAVHTLAGQSTRAALRGVGRAALQGAAAGALFDGAFATYEVLRAQQDDARVDSATDDSSEEKQERPFGGRAPTRREAAEYVALRVARGAVAGGVGVAAAGAVSAGVALTGVTVAGLPVALPIATMVGAGMLAERIFDRIVAPRARRRLTAPKPAPQEFFAEA